MNENLSPGLLIPNIGCAVDYDKSHVVLGKLNKQIGSRSWRKTNSNTSHTYIEQQLTQFSSAMVGFVREVLHLYLCACPLLACCLGDIICKLSWANTLVYSEAVHSHIVYGDPVFKWTFLRTPIKALSQHEDTLGSKSNKGHRCKSWLVTM